MTNHDIIKIINEIAPECIAESWDNVGLLIGGKNDKVEKILISLDVTDDVIDEAISLSANLIITHHPIIFKPINRIDFDTSLGCRIKKLIKFGLSVYVVHTNLDSSPYGTNDTLFSILGLHDAKFLEESNYDGYGMGLVGDTYLDITLAEFATIVRDKLDLQYINFVGDKTAKIKKVGICTGSAANKHFFTLAKNKDCDVYITADISYHDAHDALDLDLNLIDATHFATENIVSNRIKKYLEDKVDISVYSSSVIKTPFTSICYENSR